MKTMKTTHVAYLLALAMFVALTPQASAEEPLRYLVGKDIVIAKVKRCEPVPRL